MRISAFRPDPEAMFSRLVADYVNGKQELNDFIHYPAGEQGITDKLRERKFSLAARSRLVAVLRRQYEGLIKEGELTQQQINSLLEDETYTVTTGHQLGLFGSPAFFHYKILHTIALAKDLQQRFPGRHIVPIFWMATEDHDFEEISQLHIEDKTYTWKKPVTGDIPVGKLPLTGLDELIRQMETDFPFNSGLHKALMEYKTAIRKSKDLAAFTRNTVHQLYQEHGLLVIDGDDAELKQALMPVITADLAGNEHYEIITKITAELERSYTVQAIPRRYNFFLFRNGIREKISEELQPNEQEKQNPALFSPNVFFRPLYQELILPNLAYIGGPGEIAYWLQLKTLFEKYQVKLPVLIVRNSVFFSRQFLWEKFADFPEEKLFELLLKDQNYWWDWLLQQFEKDGPNLGNALEPLRQLSDFEQKLGALDPTLLEKWKAFSHQQKQEQAAFQRRINKRLKERNWEKFNDLLRLAQQLHPNSVPQERILSFLNFMYRSGKPVMTGVLEAMKGDLFHPQVINVTE